MTDEQRAIDLEIEVSGTPEEVWRAIATGPGISSWYVPHVVDEREGGTASASFGAGPEMQVDGRVAAWEPHRRIVFDGGDADTGLAFEWLIEARDGSSCVVRLINSGFGRGDDWDDQFDAMRDGWQLFLRNLQLHRRHFPGQTATAMLPTASWPGPQDEAWARLIAGLGINSEPAVGDRLEIATSLGARLGGSVADVNSWSIALLLDEPAPGTAFITVEKVGGDCSVSIWSYLYGDDQSIIAERDVKLWQTWLDEHTAAT